MKWIAAAALMLALPACGPGPGTHARVRFHDETNPTRAPAAFSMPLASIALVGETDRDVIWQRPDAAASAPIDFLGAVNEQVDSSMNNLSLGEYTHVEVRLCETGAATVEWRAMAASDPRKFETSCVKTAALDESIAVGSGEQVTVILDFDASTTIRARDDGDDCDGTTCFAVPAFEPRLDVEIVVE